MAKARRVIVLVLLAISLVAILGSCTLITAIFGPNKKKVVEWVPGLTVGSTINYKVSYSSTDPSVTAGSSTFKATIQDIVTTNNGDRETVTVNWGGSTQYAIFDNTTGKMYLSSDNTIDATSDFNYLKTPIESGTTWYGPYNDLLDLFPFDLTNTQFKIQNTKQTVDVGTDTVKDAVTLSITLDSQYDNYFVSPGGYVITAFTISVDYSPTYGFVGQTVTENAGGYTYTYRLTVTDVTKA